MKTVWATALLSLTAACGLVKFSINGAGVDISASANNTTNGGCLNDDFISVSINTADLAASIAKGDDFNSICLDSDPSKLNIRLTFQLDSLDPSKTAGDQCLVSHPDPFGSYSIDGLTISYDYEEKGEAKSDSFTVNCTKPTIDFANAGGLADSVNACLDEIEQSWKPDMITALNRHPKQIKVRSATEECDPAACFHLDYTFKVMVTDSLASTCP